MTVAERLKSVIDEHHMKPAEACRVLNISNSSFTDWKNGRGNPSLDVVVKFSDYFHLSLDYLVRGVEFQQELTDESLDFSNAKEKRCLLKFRRLPADMQEKALSYLDGMLAVLPDEETEKGTLSA